MTEIFTKTDYQDDGVPPKSKKLIAICSWSWGPAHSRSEIYCISGSRSRKEWSLWSRPLDIDLGSCWTNPAFARFAHRTSARDAAKALLKAAWLAEWKAYRSPGSGACVDQAGLLDQDDIEQLEAVAYEMGDTD
jgi:hypothetical protein